MLCSARPALALLGAALLASAQAQALPASHCPGADALPAQQIAPARLLEGEGFTVDPCARLVGHLGRFLLRPDSPADGSAVVPPVLEVESLDLLAQRVAEMALLRQLRDIGRAEAAAEAAWASLQQTGSAVGQVVTRPVESVIGMPAGALRFLGRQAGELGRHAANAGDRASAAFSAAPQGSGLQLRPGAEPPPGPEATPWWQAGGHVALRHGQRWIGYSAARRDLAQRLGIDPYSGNAWLDAEMDRLTWAALAGRRGVGLGLGQLGTAAGNTLAVSGRVHRMVWEQSPEAVTAWNRERLGLLRCGAEARDAFFDNGRFSPTLQTRLVDALLALAPQQGCELPLELAARVEREVDARYLIDQLHLLMAQQPRFPLRFEAAGPALVLRDGEDRLWLALPVDRLIWTPETAAYFEASAFPATTGLHLIVGRNASPEARSALLAQGWSIIEEAIGPARIRLEEAPAAPF
ncbi:hypothetical protein [Silanimonas sp.]|uniref:hypothetical protein n=1 Tax=Silanimonas sp. TaxID=1929290 RepID=UPI001BC235B6|nr:hypothetical protein [Silanimonas sp.]MBS3895528.1 hypothetical protein [Silanimonas sp.]